MLPTKFGVNWPFGSVKKRKIYFQDGGHGGHLGFPIGTILAIFDLKVTPMLPTKFRVNWLFGSGEKAKNRFSRWRPWRPSWNSDQNDFSYFWSTSHPDASYQVSSQLALRFILDFRLEWFLLFFDLQVNLILPTKYQVNWPRGVGGVGF